jgi:hypothetical protein
MMFFTRQLYQDTQPKSGRERWADREWSRRAKIYEQYEATIQPLLPPSVVRFSRKSFHDAEVEAISQSSGGIVMILDSRPCGGRRVRLTFSGVRRRIRTRGLVGQWLFYREIHLCSRARFSVHFLFTMSEAEIDADEILLKTL